MTDNYRDRCTLRLLEEARDLIRFPESWCQGAKARNINGRQVRPKASTAISYCTIGALERAAYNAESTEMVFRINPARDMLSAHVPDESRIIAKWQDTHGRTHREILQLYDNTIRTLRHKLTPG